MIQSYDNYFLPVDDMKKAKQFYESLGLTKKFYFGDKGMVAYRVGTEKPAIILKDKNIFSHSKPTVWFVVDDVFLTYETMIHNNIHFLSSPFAIATGTAVEFEDLFGNRLGITDYKER